MFGLKQPRMHFLSYHPFSNHPVTIVSISIESQCIGCRNMSFLRISRRTMTSGSKIDIKSSATTAFWRHLKFPKAVCDILARVSAYVVDLPFRSVSLKQSELFLILSRILVLQPVWHQTIEGEKGQQHDCVHCGIRIRYLNY